LGLFKILGSIAKAIPGPIGSALSAHDSKKAVGKANDATQLGLTNAKNDLSSQLATSMAALEPYTTPGALATGRRADILGLNGNEAQSTAISGVHSSPLFQALFNTGRDSTLAAASATGGLRGGNVNEALARNGENAFAGTLQQLLSDLGGLSQEGLGATEFGANLGSQTAGNIANLDVGSGQSNAGAILGKQSIDNTFYSGLRAAITNAVMAGAGGGAGGAGGFNATSLDPSVFDPTRDGASTGGISGQLPHSSGFDLSATLKSLLGGGGISPAASPLSNVSGGGFTNAIPTGYKF
jgi:hypothetical protein